MTRRAALSIVAALIGRQQGSAATQTPTCRPVPETLVLNLGAGACATKRVQVRWNAFTANVSVDELMQALGATLGDNE